MQRSVLLDRLAADSSEEVLRHRKPGQKARLNAGLEQFEKTGGVIDEPFLFGLDMARKGSDFLLLNKGLIAAAGV